MEIPVHFTPRNYQIDALQAMEAGASLVALCWSRRAGKDMTAFSYAVKEMVKQPMNVVLVFPTKDQGKTSFWENIENDGFKTIEHIPSQLIARKDNSNMRIILKNGSTFQVLGATDPEALRGANGRIYILSEMVDIPSSVMDVIRPIVAVNGGQIIMVSTPKIDGISGATFKMYFDMAKNNKNWYSSLITADLYLSKDLLEELRQECIVKFGNDFYWKQEYMCDWGQVSASSYFGGALKLAEDRGHIGIFPYIKEHPVYTSWDLGIADSTAVSSFQYIKKIPRVIDYFQINDVGTDPIIKFIISKPYNYGHHFLPHDGSVRDSDAIQRIQKFRTGGLVNVSLLRKEPKDDGIKRMIENIPKTYFHEPTTSDLIKKMLLYKRKFNPNTGDYMGPEHKSESHANDSLRGMYKAIETMFDKNTGEFLYSSKNIHDSYEMESVLTPNFFGGL